MSRKREGEDERISEDFAKTYNVTRREQEILRKLADGKSNREISDELYVSVRTIDTHVYNIFRKCGVKNRIELLSLITRF